MPSYVHTTFDDGDRAKQAVQALLNEGFPTQDISLSQKRGSHSEAVRLRHRTRALRHGLYGALFGAVVGLLGAFIVPPSTQVWMLQGFMAMLSPIAWVAALQGIFIGAVFFGLCGVVTGAAFWRQEPLIAKDVDSVSVGVHTQQGHMERATHALEQVGARDIEYSEDPASS